MKHVVLLQKICPQRIPKCDVLVDESHIWIKRSNNSPSKKKQLPARSCCLSPCSATESKPLDQKVFWKESIRLAKINRLGFGKVWGRFFFSKMLYDLNIPSSFEISNFTGRHIFPFETSEKLYPWPSHLFRDFLDAWVSLVFTTVKLCQFNRTKVKDHRVIWMFPKIVVPQIIHFNRVFHYKPSILGVSLFLETPIWKGSEVHIC